MKSFVKGMLGALLILAVFLLGVFVAVPTARAQDAPIKGDIPLQCLPNMHTDRHIASPLWVHYSIHGVCVEHWCVDRKTGLRQMNTYCGLLSELPKVGGRVQTIIKSADPLKTARESPKRFEILPLTDTRFNELRSELR